MYFLVFILFSWIVFFFICFRLFILILLVIGVWMCWFYVFGGLLLRLSIGCVGGLVLLLCGGLGMVMSLVLVVCSRFIFVLVWVIVCILIWRLLRCCVRRGCVFVLVVFWLVKVFGCCIRLFLKLGGILMLFLFGVWCCCWVFCVGWCFCWYCCFVGIIGGWCGWDGVGWRFICGLMFGGWWFEWWGWYFVFGWLDVVIVYWICVMLNDVWYWCFWMGFCC